MSQAEEAEVAEASDSEGEPDGQPNESSQLAIRPVRCSMAFLPMTAMLIDADAAAAHIRVVLAHTAPEARGDLHQTGTRRQRLPMPIAASMRLRPALRKPQQIFRFQSHRDLRCRGRHQLLRCEREA
jgi:hypothetical protein